MALDICNYTPITNCLLQSSNDRFSFLFTQVCNLINSSDSNYVLPIATDTVLGGIIVGDGLSMDPDTGVLSVIPDFIPSLRFGIEDNLSDQDRQFDLGGFTFELFSDTGDITQYGSIFLDNQSVSATASDGVTVGGFDAQVNGARIFSNEGDIIKQISTTESAIEVLQTDGIDTYIQTFPLSTGFVVTSVNNVLADEFGNVNIVAVTAGTLQDVTENGPSTTIDLTLASVDITGLALDGDEGTNGQLLVSAGPGNTPVWVNPSVIPSSDLQTVTNSGPSTTNDLSLASINITGLTLSGSGGSANQVLITNGSGTPSWGMPTLQQIATSGNMTDLNITLGALTAPTHRLHIKDSVGNAGSGVLAARGIMLENTVTPVFGTSQYAPPITFKSNQLYGFDNSINPINFTIAAVAGNYGSPGVEATRPATQLRFYSTDFGSTQTPLTLYSDGDVMLANGINFPNDGDSRINSGGTTRHTSNSTTLKQEFFNAVGPLQANGTHMWIYQGNATGGALSSALKVWGDANINLMTNYANGTTMFGLPETLDPFAQIQMCSKGRGLKLPIINDDQRDGIPQGVASIPLGLGGSGYVIPPAVVIQSPVGGGLPARAHATVSGGQVTGIILDFRGSNYPTPPVVTFDNTGTGGIGNPDGSGATIGTVTVDTLPMTEALVIYNPDADGGDGGIQFYNGAGVWKTLATL